MENKKTIVVNLFGGPGCGKSTIAAGLFYRLKCEGNYDCELVTEVAKDIIWNGNVELLKDQTYVLGNQYHRIWRLIGKVDVIICDSPFLLCPIYDNMKSTGLLLNALDKHRELNNIDIFITRPNIGFKDNGRNYNYNESLKKDKSIKYMLNKYEIPHFSIRAKDSEKTVEKILNILRKYLF